MKKTAFISFVFLVLPLVFVQAEQGGNLNAQERQEARQEKIQERLENRCEKIQNRIGNRINKYDEGKISTENVYKRLKTRIGNLVTKLENNGIDASKLKNDLSTLNEKIEKVASDYGVFVAALKETKNYACGESQGQFRNKLQESRKLLGTVKQDRKETREYVVNTIIPDIKSLREQLKNKIQEQNQAGQ